MYQAVAEYWANAKEPEYDLNVDILLPGRSKPDRYNFNNNNNYATRTSKVRTHSAIMPVAFCMLVTSVDVVSLCVVLCCVVCVPPQVNDINQNVKVTATGTGEATVTVNKKHLFARSSVICCKSTVSFSSQMRPDTFFKPCVNNAFQMDTCNI